MNPPPVQVERRAGQRFPFLLPVFVHDTSNGVEARGFTQDISSRGVFLFTDAAFREGAEIELTLNMPSEITLGDDMRVRCRGHILRVVRPTGKSPAVNAPQGRSVAPAETKIGVAVRLLGYEYLPETVEESAGYHRASALHSHDDHEEDRGAPALVRPVLG